MPIPRVRRQKRRATALMIRKAADITLLWRTVRTPALLQRKAWTRTMPRRRKPNRSPRPGERALRISPTGKSSIRETFPCRLWSMMPPQRASMTRSPATADSSRANTPATRIPTGTIGTGADRRRSALAGPSMLQPGSPLRNLMLLWRT